ncbi:hypothetical protein, partial [Nostoc sp. KVJ20]|uniref:hypothetical protein n=1 Tax=Nostoc sp. KVJ20 TaxID=457944 RepID=UPI00114CF40C
MKSTQRPSKPQQPKSSNQIPEFHPTPDDGKLLEELTTDQQPGHAPVDVNHPEPPKVEQQPTGKRNKKKIDSPPVTKPHIPFQDRSEEPELPP